MLFHRVANTLNYMDIKTVVVSCGTCYDQLQSYEFDKIFPGSRIIDIHEYLLEKGITLGAAGGGGYAPRPVPQPHEAAGANEDGAGTGGRQRARKQALPRCESGGLATSRPDVSTQIRFRKEEEIRKGEAALREAGSVASQENVKILTSCPSCLMGLNRYQDDLKSGLLEADYIVVEMAKQIWARTGCLNTLLRPIRAASSGYWCK